MSRHSLTRQRRTSVQAKLSFPDEDVEKARRFVEAGSLLEDCSPRHAVFRNPFVRRRSLSHYSVDASWQFLQEAATPSAPSTRKWHFADMTVVNPIINDDVRLSRLSGVNALHKLKLLGRSDLEFQMVHGRRRTKFRAGTREEVRLWVTALQSHLVERGARSAVDQFSDMALGHFQKADADDDGGLSFQEVELMLKKCNMKPSEEYLGKIFKIFDKDNNLTISEEEFPELFFMLLGKTHLREIFNMYSVEGVSDSCGQRVMPFSEFVRFTQEVQGGLQGEESIRSSIRSLLASLSEPFIVPEADALTETGFNFLMSSKTNSILDPERSRLYQDMSQPLSHYWINCSHNTYLEGAQIAGSASVEQYLEVLSQGCRCVEIDLWDGPNGQPMVTHGYTLSSKLLFEEVVQALQDHAFDHSDFPLILSLENHCSKEQVVRVGQILVEIFGGRLLRHQEGFEGQPLVSPEEARRRVLVKGSLVHIPGLVEEVPLSEENSRLSSKPGIASAVYTRVKSITSTRTFNSTADVQLGVQQFNSVIYLVSRKHRSLTEERQPCNISSFSETRAIGNCRKHGQDLNAYHRDNLSRIFPPGQNVGSRNLAPLLHWVHGAQLVALNFQKMDTSVLLNEGVFREHNGGFGYVLKPDAVLAPGEGRGPQELKLTITVLSAHFLPRPEGVREESLVTAPLVVISVHGPDGEPVQQETRPAKHDGVSPTWEETFEFQVTREDVSIITFEVFHQDAKLSSRAFVAQAAYPVSGLRAGVRWVPLWDHGRRSVPNCGILAKVQMEHQGEFPAAAATGGLAAAAACAPPNAGQCSAKEPELYSSESTSTPEDSKLLGDLGSMQIYRNHVSM